MCAIYPVMDIDLLKYRYYSHTLIQLLLDVLYSTFVCSCLHPRTRQLEIYCCVYKSKLNSLDSDSDVKVSTNCLFWCQYQLVFITSSAIRAFDFQFKTQIEFAIIVSSFQCQAGALYTNAKSRFIGYQIKHLN